MKPLVFFLFAVFALGSLGAQTIVWQPSQGHMQVPIWPGAVPDAAAVVAAGPETAEMSTNLIAGKPTQSVSNVSRPTMTVYSPKGKNTGAAVVVFPGGGYQELAIDLEGTEVCDWLTSRGITCVLLKYRVPDSGPAWHDDCRCYIHPKAPTALEDAQRTVGLMRFHAVVGPIAPRKNGKTEYIADLITQKAQSPYIPR
jgi:acetyl esterase/lipase